jgi:hypothetical protein
MASCRAGVGDIDLADPLATLSTHQLSRLVGRNRHQPRSQPRGFAQRGELSPGDRPGDLDRVLGQILIAADDVRDPGHVVVVSADDSCEGVSVAGSSLGYRRRCDAASRDRYVVHHVP